MENIASTSACACSKNLLELQLAPKVSSAQVSANFFKVKEFSTYTSVVWKIYYKIQLILYS
jgi:hypothetical protein